MFFKLRQALLTGTGKVSLVVSVVLEELWVDTSFISAALSTI